MPVLSAAAGLVDFEAPLSAVLTLGGGVGRCWLDCWLGKVVAVKEEFEGMSTLMLLTAPVEREKPVEAWLDCV